MLRHSDMQSANQGGVQYKVVSPTIDGTRRF
jgi:hypothetical protein